MNTTIPPIAIAVLERGFVYVGNISISDGYLTIRNGYCVRKWGTNAGLGQLAKEGPRPQTVLDPAPDVLVPMHALIHLLAIEQSKWPQYAK